MNVMEIAGVELPNQGHEKMENPCPYRRGTVSQIKSYS